MKKDQSKIHLFGNKNGKRILLIHGMGFNWKNCFDKVLHLLGKDYYFCQAIMLRPTVRLLLSFLVPTISVMYC